MARRGGMPVPLLARFVNPSNFLKKSSASFGPVELSSSLGHLISGLTTMVDCAPFGCANRSRIRVCLSSKSSCLGVPRDWAANFISATSNLFFSSSTSDEGAGGLRAADGSEIVLRFVKGGVLIWKFWRLTGLLKAPSLQPVLFGGVGVDRGTPWARRDLTCSRSTPCSSSNSDKARYLAWPKISPPSADTSSSDTANSFLSSLMYKQDF